MHIHRNRHMRAFSTLPNYLLQDHRMSYTAQGVLTYLLSLADGTREDGRRMADARPQGRGAVAKALRELQRLGYYRVETIRKPDGKLISASHVYDSPQPPQPQPSARKAGSGAATSGATDGQSKNQGKNHPSLPSLPAEPADDAVADGASATPERAEPATPPAPAEQVPPEVRVAVATLFRVLRPEPRLRLGEAEALALAPLVAEWLEHGATEHDLATALLPGLPQRVHAPVAFLRNRLTRKRPPAPSRQPAVPAQRWHECAQCADPVPRPGICRTCAGLPAPPPTNSFATAAAARGAALVRAALRGSMPGTVSTA
ncbi:hypothetical protein ABH940_001223 [Streptacidiphilus sp. BW17]|uniref:hypothetical protein n=1 Tax=Streptacidiphilus sp. BW17 TaxID=3156274 RepID=UPI0035181B41